MTESTVGKLSKQRDICPPGEKVEGVPQQDTLSVGDGLHTGGVADNLGHLFDVTGVRDREAVEKVHEDDYNQEDEGEEEGEGEPGERAGGRDGKIRELEFPNKHCAGFDQA